MMKKSIQRSTKIESSVTDEMILLGEVISRMELPADSVWLVRDATEDSDDESDETWSVALVKNRLLVGTYKSCDHIERTVIELSTPGKVTPDELRELSDRTGSMPQSVLDQIKLPIVRGSYLSRTIIHAALEIDILAITGVRSLDGLLTTAWRQSFSEAKAVQWEVDAFKRCPIQWKLEAA